MKWEIIGNDLTRSICMGLDGRTSNCSKFFFVYKHDLTIPSEWSHWHRNIISLQTFCRFWPPKERCAIKLISNRHPTLTHTINVYFLKVFHFFATFFLINCN